MKGRTLLLIFSVCILQSITAQVTVDTVSIGTGYANQVWYSLPNDNQGTAPKNNWDIAFDASGFGYSILINSAVGTTLWGYPGGDISKWNTLDTTGINTWPKRWNSDTSWVYGAFNRYANPANPYDLDWGIYSTITHYVTGDSLYVIKLATNSYKKLWIQSLASGIYTFRYANLDGSADTTIQLNKAAYVTKNFIYYSLQAKTIIDREPAKTLWDLTFTQYSTFLPEPYTVTGILHNSGVQIAKAASIGNTASYVNYSAHKFKTGINEIGYNWKSFTGADYVIEDSLVYFVKRNNGDIWKMIFSGFDGSTNGNFIFSKQKIVTAGIKDEKYNTNSILSIYPNPSTEGKATIVYDFQIATTSPVINIYDLSGRVILTESISGATGLNTYIINTSTFNSGMYFVSIKCNGKTIQQKLIVK